MAQMTTTMPAPFDEYSIIESWFNAVNSAKDYILIEDQYFRIPMLVDAIVSRMDVEPALQLVVVTNEVKTSAPECRFTFETIATLHDQFPERTHFFSLSSVAFDFPRGGATAQSTFVDIDIHAKTLFVDDEFASIGSANKNHRSAVTDGESAVAIYDRTWVRNARRRIVANILQREEVPVSDASSEWIAALERASVVNAEIRQTWNEEESAISVTGWVVPSSLTPEGFVYPLTQRAARTCTFQNISPDIF